MERERGKITRFVIETATFPYIFKKIKKGSRILETNAYYYFSSSKTRINSPKKENDQNILFTPDHHNTRI